MSRRLLVEQRASYPASNVEAGFDSIKVLREIEMSVGHIRDGQMNRVSKADLESAVAKCKGPIRIKDLIQSKCSEPDSEFQRPRVWSISQGLAELHREKVVDIFTAHDDREDKDSLFVIIRNRI